MRWHGPLWTRHLWGFRGQYFTEALSAQWKDQLHTFCIHLFMLLSVWGRTSFCLLIKHGCPVVAIHNWQVRNEISVSNGARNESSSSFPLNTVSLPLCREGLGGEMIGSDLAASFSSPAPCLDSRYAGVWQQSSLPRILLPLWCNWGWSSLWCTLLNRMHVWLTWCPVTSLNVNCLWQMDIQFFLFPMRRIAEERFWTLCGALTASLQEKWCWTGKLRCCKDENFFYCGGFRKFNSICLKERS